MPDKQEQMLPEGLPVRNLGESPPSQLLANTVWLSSSEGVVNAYPDGT